MNKETAKKFVKADKVQAGTWRVKWPAERDNWDFRTYREQLFSWPNAYNKARRFRSEKIIELAE